MSQPQGSSQVSIPVFTEPAVATSEASITRGSELRVVKLSPTTSVNAESATPTEHSSLSAGELSVDYHALGESPSANQGETAEAKKDDDQLFDDLANFAIHDRPITNCCWKGFKYSILTFASVTCIVLYIPGALAYGRRKESDAETGQQLAGNTLPSAVVMLNASHHFINFKEDIWCVDQALGEWIDKSLAKIEPWETTLAVIISAISAFPLSIPTYELNSDYSEPVRYTMAGVVQLDYTLNHTMAMWILLNFPLTQKILLLPLLPFYYAGKGIYYCSLTEDEKYAKAFWEEVAYDHHQMKTALAETFNNATDTIVDNKVTLNFEAWKKHSWQEKFTQSFFEYDPTSVAHLQDKAAIEQYVGLLEVAAGLEKPKTPSRLGACYQQYVKPCLKTVNKGVSKLMWLAGAIGMTVSVAGFLEDTRQQLEIWTGSKPGSFELTTPTALTIGTITSYFGGSIVQDTYDNTIAWLSGHGQLPLAVKLYPKTVTLALIVSGYLSWFASGTAEELVYDTIEPGLLQDILVGFARHGVQLFTFRNMFDIIFKAVEIHAQKWGNDDDKAVFELKAQAKRFSMAVKRLDGPKLEAALKKKIPELLELMMRMKFDRFQQLTKHHENVEAKLEANQRSRFRNRFWARPRGTANPPPYIQEFLATSNVKALTPL